MWDWLRKLINRIIRKVSPPKIVAYYNGPCPLCGEHIGSDVTEDLRGNRSLICGACNKEIHHLLRLS